MDPVRHRLLVYVPINDLAALVCQGASVTCVEGIPPSAILVRAVLDHQRDAVALTFEHDSFPPVAPGTHLQDAYTERRIVGGDEAGP